MAQNIVLSVYPILTALAMLFSLMGLNPGLWRRRLHYPGSHVWSLSQCKHVENGVISPLEDVVWEKMG